MINKWEIKDNHMGNVHMDLFIKAIWDEENKIYYSQSNVRGLHIEAATFELFKEVVFDVIDELIEANHPELNNNNNKKSIPNASSKTIKPEISVELAWLMAEKFYRRLIGIIRKHGGVLVRQGKGSHEIWVMPEGRKATIPNPCKKPPHGKRSS